MYDRPARNVLRAVPSSAIPVAMVPIMAAIDLVPGKVFVVAMAIPPFVGVEAQSDMRKMHLGISVPAIAKSVASDIS